MKRVVVIPALLAMHSFVQAENLTPEIYSTISEEAQENSVKFDGIRILGGFLYSQNKFTAGSSNKMNILGATLGCEYAKLFKQKFIIGVDLLLNILQSKKKEGSWSDINKDYNNTVAASVAGNRTAEMKTSSFSADVAIKCGYQLKSYSSLIYAKLGIGILPTKATCKYFLNQAEYARADFKWRPITASIGCERKFNSKWGGIVEVGLGLEKKANSFVNSYNHQMKLRRINISIMGTYSVKSGL